MDSSKWASPSKIVDTGLKEFSVIYTDRAVNLLSEPFKKSMQNISAAMKEVYACHSIALIPGSGTYAMEAVARQFCTNKKALILRNGYFSYRWSDIMEVCKFTKGEPVVLKAVVAPGEADKAQPHFAPRPISELVAAIHTEKPAVVFAPHVETSTGMILPDEYLKALAGACHKIGAFFVLDCIASGNIWVNMAATGVDVLISAPQKGWSGPACCGIVMLNERARKAALDASSQPAATSFCCNLKQWIGVMDEYDAGRSKYYTTLPTDSLASFSLVIDETRAVGFKTLHSTMVELGAKIRAVLEARGFKSVAAKGFKAPSVIVSYSPYSGMYTKFQKVGLQIAGGVPFKLGEEKLPIPVLAPKVCFRLGMFGLDKLANVDECVKTFTHALDAIVKNEPSITSKL